jgi:hypothetical protein
MPDRDEEPTVDSAKSTAKGKSYQRPASAPPKSTSTSNSGAIQSQSLSIPQLSFTAATPETSPHSLPPRPASEQGHSGVRAVTPARTASESSTSKGKRKAEDEAEAEADVAPPDQKKDIQKATFVVPTTPRRKF